MEPKYPNIEVKLTETDGNAFAIVGAVRNALRSGGVPADEVSAFMKESMSDDYAHLLQTCMAWVTVS